jgi:hypothetical protein
LTKHLSSTSRDLLDCKEELMSGRFKWAGKMQ